MPRSKPLTRWPQDDSTAEYRGVAEQLQAIDPSVARTLANATFTARAPRQKAMAHFKQFAELIQRFQGDVDFARILAKATFRTPDPLKAAEAFIRDYNAVGAALASNGVEAHIAQALASSSGFRRSFRTTSEGSPIAERNHC